MAYPSLYVCCLAWLITLSSCQFTNPFGLINTPNLPQFLTADNTPLPGGTPWGNYTHGQVPDTGMVRKYEFNITRGYGAPDGYNRTLLLINGQWMGPLIEANWGDTIQVTVYNNIVNPEEGTTIHWHGQPIRLSPGMDGVPSVSQCPIAPGSNFTYTYRAELWGTSWYHSHVSGQRFDGVQGPMAIYGPTNVDYDIDIGPVILSDWSHTPAGDFVSDALERPPDFVNLENNLINGRNPFNCELNDLAGSCTNDTTRSAFQFTSGKTHRLRLVNVGSSDNVKFSIDDHIFTVIANDYVQIVPYNTKIITLGPGQRTDVIVNGTGNSTSSYWMRSNLDTNVICGNTTTLQPDALAMVYYENSDTSVDPDTEGTLWVSNNCQNDPLELTVPYYPEEPAAEPDITQVFNITTHLNETGYLLIYINNQSFRGDYNDPLLLLANEGNTSYPADPDWMVYNFNQNKTVRAIFYNYFAAPHPFHLHGHNFWVLAEGTGEWDGSITNPSNPQRRDTQIVAPGYPNNPYYTVIQWRQDNPGVWPLHCHVLLHVSLGLYLNSMERPADIAKQTTISDTMAQTCQVWDAWSASHVVDQVDSGLK